MVHSIKFDINSINNPIYLSALGVAPLVAMSNTLSTGLFMGSFFSINLVMVALLMSSLRSMVPRAIRLAYLLVISSACVSILGLLAQATFFQLHQSVHVYLQIIAMNCLLLYFLETDTLRYPPREIIKPLCHISGLIIMICLLVGSAREMLSFGGLFMTTENVPTDHPGGMGVLPDEMILSIFNTASGAFILTGCVFALINVFVTRMASNQIEKSNQ